jgi:hypothetical protein
MEVFLPLLLTLPTAAGTMIAAGLGLSILVVAVMFMLSYALQMPEMVALAREELASLVLTVIIVIFFVGSDSFLNSAVNGFLLSTLPPDLQSLASAAPSGGISKSHIDLAIGTLGILEKELKARYIELYLFEILIGFLSTISFPIGSPVRAVNIISFSLAPFTGLTLLSNAHTIVVEAIGYMVTLLWAKQFILIFARDTVPIMLFPLGLILRAIPFFRKTGSSVIAIAIALYFIMPFAMIFSNYLIFDAYKPPDFAYMPNAATYLGTDRSMEDVTKDITKGRDGQDTKDFMGAMGNSNSVVGESSNDANDPCVGNWAAKAYCSGANVISSVGSAFVNFAKTIWNIWKFMVGMTGDFLWTAFNNPLMPASASAGLYYFIIREVADISPMIILVMFTTVLEIIITITGYRSISMLIGGEAELTGITKVI